MLGSGYVIARLGDTPRSALFGVEHDCSATQTQPQHATDGRRARANVRAFLLFFLQVFLLLVLGLGLCVYLHGTNQHLLRTRLEGYKKAAGMYTQHVNATI